MTKYNSDKHTCYSLNLITIIIRTMLTVIMVMMLTLLSKGWGPTNSQTLVADCYCSTSWERVETVAE